MIGRCQTTVDNDPQHSVVAQCSRVQCSYTVAAVVMSFHVYLAQKR